MLLIGTWLFKGMRMIGGIFLISGVLALGSAYGGQYFFHLVPCELCLWERWPWRVLTVLGILSLVLSSRFARWPVLACFLCLLVSIGLSVLHVGVEQGLWPSPAAECHVDVTHAETIEDWLSHLPVLPVKPCDQPDYVLGLPFSVTTLAAIYSVVVFGLALVGAVCPFRCCTRRDPDRVKDGV